MAYDYLHHAMRQRGACLAHAVFAVLSLVSAFAFANPLADNFWINIGGDALEGYGADRTDLLSGGPTATYGRGNSPYMSYRYGVNGASFGYNFPVENPGIFTCGLHFIELELDGPGQRLFSVTVNGQFEKDIDVFASVGKYNGFVKTFNNIDASFRTIEVRFFSAINNPFLAAITCSRMSDATSTILGTVTTASPSFSTLGDTQQTTQQWTSPTTARPTSSHSTHPPTTAPTATAKSLATTTTAPPAITSSAITSTTTSSTASISTTATTDPLTTTSFETPTSSSEAKNPRSTVTVDPPLSLEDDEFYQRYELLLTADPGFVTDDSLKRSLKDMAADATNTDVSRWAVIAIEDGGDGPDHSSTDGTVRESGSTKSRGSSPSVVKALGKNPDGSVYSYITLVSALRHGKDSKNKYDSMTRFISSGEGTKGLQGRGHSGVQRLEFATPPSLSSEATALPQSNGSSGSRNTGAIVGGSVLGVIALLALVSVIALIAIRRSRANRIDADSFDQPPPVLDDMDIEDRDEYGQRNMQGLSVEYMDDPDSTFTAATSHAAEELYTAPESGITLDKDVWGRGTGSDY